MFKDFENLYVVDVIEPMCLFGSSTSKFEDSILLENCICRKENMGEDNFIYRDIGNNKVYYYTDKIGYTRVKKDSVRALSLYYNFLGLPRIRGMEDSKKVRGKVRSLKRGNKI